MLKKETLRASCRMRFAYPAYEKSALVLRRPDKQRASGAVAVLLRMGVHALALFVMNTQSVLRFGYVPYSSALSEKRLSRCSAGYASLIRPTKNPHWSCVGRISSAHPARGGVAPNGSACPGTLRHEYAERPSVRVCTVFVRPVRKAVVTVLCRMRFAYPAYEKSALVLRRPDKQRASGAGRCCSAP